MNELLIILLPVIKYDFKSAFNLKKLISPIAENINLACSEIQDEIRCTS